MASQRSLSDDPRAVSRTSSPGMSRRQMVLLGAAIFGGLAGGLFSGEIAAAAGSVWSNYVVPAYFELLLSGIPLCA